MATGTGAATARARQTTADLDTTPSIDWPYAHALTAEEVDEIITALGYENNPKGNTAFGLVWGASEQTVRRWRNGRARIDHGGGFRLGTYHLATKLGIERRVKMIFNRYRPS